MSFLSIGDFGFLLYLISSYFICKIGFQSILFNEYGVFM